MYGSGHEIGVPAYDEAGGVEIVRFIQALDASSSVPELQHRFVTGFGRLLAVPMYAMYVFDAELRPPGRVVSSNVSDVFLARYERIRGDDPMHAQVLETGSAVYNRAIVAEEEWLETRIYREAKQLHGIRYGIEAPLVGAEGIFGTINFSSSDPARGFTARERVLAEMIGRIAGNRVESLRAMDGLAQERDQALAALELAGTAVVLSERGPLEPRLNDAARRLLADLSDSAECLYRLIARPVGHPSEAFSQRVLVELRSGGTATVHGYSRPVPGAGGGLITVLEFEERAPLELAPGPLATLTPREREIARLVVEDLANREIAEQLHLSHHTVSQYVKRIYRKLEVGSRVALTRLLLR